MNVRSKVSSSRSAGVSSRAAASAVLIVVLVAALGTLVYLNPPSSATASSQGAYLYTFTNYLQTTSGNATTTTTATSVPANAVKVDMPDDGGYPYSQYTPQQVTVVIGVNNTVLWTNSDRIVHNVIQVTGVFNSGDMSPGGQYWFTFTIPGVYSYYCSYHPSMSGVVIVKSQ